MQSVVFSSELPFTSILQIRQSTGFQTRPSAELVAGYCTALTPTAYPTLGKVAFIGSNFKSNDDAALDRVLANVFVWAQTGRQEVHALSPGYAISFTNGQASLDVTVLPYNGGGTTVRLWASDDFGRGGLSTPFTVSMPSNLPPTAISQSFTLVIGANQTVNLTGIDPEGQPLIYSLDAFPAHGLLTATAAPRTFLYRPEHRFAGTDSFSFKVSDGTLNSAPAFVSFTVPMPTDSDLDGMPDDWENDWQIYAIPVVGDYLAQAGADPDGDGLINLHEYWAGTNPLDPTSRLSAVLEWPSEQPLSLTFPAIGSVRYRLQSSDDLSSGFIDVPTSPAMEIAPGTFGTTTTMTWSINPPDPGTARRYWRIRLAP